MALIPLNTFKTKTAVLSTNTSAVVYTAPVGVTAIILMANVANTDSILRKVTFSHYRNIPVLADAQGNGAQAGGVTTEIVKQFSLPGNDGANMLSGKMIVESLDSIIAFADVAGVMKLTLSILETANQ